MACEYDLEFIEAKTPQDRWVMYHQKIIYENEGQAGPWKFVIDEGTTGKGRLADIPIYDPERTDDGAKLVIRHIGHSVPQYDDIIGHYLYTKVMVKGYTKKMPALVSLYVNANLRHSGIGGEIVKDFVRMFPDEEHYAICEPCKIMQDYVNKHYPNKFISFI